MCMCVCVVHASLSPATFKSAFWVVRIAPPKAYPGALLLAIHVHVHVNTLTHAISPTLSHSKHPPPPAVTTSPNSSRILGLRRGAWRGASLQDAGALARLGAVGVRVVSWTGSSGGVGGVLKGVGEGGGGGWGVKGWWGWDWSV